MVTEVRGEPWDDGDYDFKNKATCYRVARLLSNRTYLGAKKFDCYFDYDSPLWRDCTVIGWINLDEIEKCMR